MKFETLMLHGLFAACLVVCLGVMGAMLMPSKSTVLAAHPTQAATATASVEG